MIFSQKRFYSPIKYLLCASLFLLIFISIILEFYVPYKLGDYLNKNPELKGYYITAGNIDYSLLSGFTLSNIEITKPAKKEKYIIINDLSVNLDFLNSIMKRKAVIELIEIDRINTNISRQLIDELSDLRSPDESAELKDKEKLRVEIDRLVINDFDINYEQEYKLKLKDLMLRLGNLEDLSVVKLRSNIEIGENNFLLQSNINRSDNALSASVDLQTPSLQIDKVKIPGLKIDSMIKTDIKNDIVSRAVVNIHENKQLIGKADININYSKKDSALIIDESVFEIFGLISLKSSGKVLDISADPKFDVSANIEKLNLEKITKPFIEQYNAQLRGEIEKNGFRIRGSIKNNINLDTMFIFNNLLFKQGDENLVIGDLILNMKGLFNFSNNLNRLTISARSDKFAGGDVKLKSEHELGENHTISGALSTKNIDLGKIFLVKKNVSGKILNLNTRFSGNTKTVDLFSDLSAKDVSIKVSETQNLWISELSSSDKILNSITFGNNSSSNLDIKLNNLAFKNLDYSDFKIDKGIFSAEVKNLLNKNRKFNLSLGGNRLENSPLNVILQNVEITSKADKNRAEKITGEINSASGSYNNYQLSDLKSDYSFGDSNLSFSRISFALKDRGRAKINKVVLPIENNLPFPFKVLLADGTFKSNDNGYELDGINLELINNQKDIWSGDISINEADLYSANFRKLSSLVSYSSSGYTIQKIKGDLLGGRLVGFLKSQNNSLKFDINLINPKIAGEENTLIAEKVNLSYNGNFKNDDTLPAGTGKFSINSLYVQDYEDESKLTMKVDVESGGETLLLKSGLINNINNDVLLSFISIIQKPFSENRNLKYKTEEMNLVEIKKFLNPYLPPIIRFGELSGGMDIELSASNFPQDSTVSGFIDFKNINIKGDPFGTDFNLENLHGRLNLGKSSEELKNINEVISRHTKNYKQAYSYTKNISRTDDSDVNIKRLDYGFFTLENIRLLMNVVKNKLTIKELSTNVFGGKLSSSGFYNIGKSKKKAGKFYFLFNDLSLKSITDSIPGTEGYISGRFNGIVSLVQKQRRTSMLDGLFDFWAVGSRKEKRVVGKAFLERLGARERLLLGSSKNYDKGELHGYINKGVITFNELQISNSFLGVKDLNIKVHNKRNSISVAHLLSVIRETARRASTGSLNFQFQN